MQHYRLIRRLEAAIRETRRQTKAPWKGVYRCRAGGRARVWRGHSCLLGSPGKAMESHRKQREVSEMASAPAIHINSFFIRKWQKTVKENILLERTTKTEATETYPQKGQCVGALQKNPSPLPTTRADLGGRSTPVLGDAAGETSIIPH